MASYKHFLDEILRLELIDQVPPIQYTIRLLIPPGSKLLDLPEARDRILALDEPLLSYRWENPDPRIDRLQKDLESLVMDFDNPSEHKREFFRTVWDRTHELDSSSTNSGDLFHGLPRSQRGPYLTEPWYC